MERYMAGFGHPMVEGYLRRLDLAARVLPDRDRDELVGDTRAQLDLLLGSDPAEADVRRALDAVGDPQRVVEALLPPGWAPRQPAARERLALVLLLGLVPLTWTTVPLAAVLWLAGVALLAWSPLWSRDQKLMAALLWPGAIGLPFALARLLLGPARPSVTDPVVLLVAMTPAVALALWLHRAAGRRVLTTGPTRRR